MDPSSMTPDQQKAVLQQAAQQMQTQIFQELMKVRIACLLMC